MTSPLGFKVRVGCALFSFVDVNVMSYPKTDLLTASITAVSLSHMHQQKWELPRIRKGNHPH